MRKWININVSLLREKLPCIRVKDETGNAAIYESVKTLGPAWFETIGRTVWLVTDAEVEASMNAKKWGTLEDCRGDQLDKFDWTKCPWPGSHPLAIKFTANQIIDYETGDVIGTLDPKYSFFLAHGHLHVCKADWDYEIDSQRAVEEWQRQLRGEI